MIEINLLPEELRKKESVKIALPEIPIKKTLYVVCGLVFGLQLLFTLVTFFLRFQETSYRHQAQVLREGSQEIARQKAETTEIFARLKETKALTTRKYHWASLLNSLTHSMTKGIWLRALYVTAEEPKSSGRSSSPVESSDKKSVKDKYLVLEGSAVGQGQETAFIGKFLKELKENQMFVDLFQDIKPSNINQRRIKEYDVYDFIIYCKFRKDKV